MKIEFDKRWEEFQESAQRWLKSVRIFITQGGLGKRISERLEAAIFKQVQADPKSLLGNGRVTMSARRADEDPITIESNADELFHDLPGKLEI